MSHQSQVPLPFSWHIPGPHRGPVQLEIRHPDNVRRGRYRAHYSSPEDVAQKIPSLQDSASIEDFDAMRPEPLSKYVCEGLDRSGKRWQAVALDPAVQSGRIVSSGVTKYQTSESILAQVCRSCAPGTGAQADPSFSGEHVWAPRIVSERQRDFAKRHPHVSRSALLTRIVRSSKDGVR